MSLYNSYIKTSDILTTEPGKVYILEIWSPYYIIINNAEANSLQRE